MLLRFACVVYLLPALVFSAPAQRKNVLFLVADDMRPELGSYYGIDFPSPVHPPMHTPNLDALAAKSLLLKQAYVSVALCNPSRTALLTSRRPDTSHIWTIGPYWRKVGGNFTTLPQYFKDNGYMTVGMGKIFHPGSSSGGDDPMSWSTPYYHAPGYGHWQKTGPCWVAVDEETEKKYPLPDVQIAENAVKTLKQVAPKAKSGEQPFFVAVGFHKPHLPFVFQKKFLDYYPIEKINVPPNQYAPSDMPEIAWNVCGGLFGHEDIRKAHVSGKPNTTLPADLVKTVRRAYYSAISYTDSLVGQVLQELEDLGLAESTIVSFWGDHGWQLGEHGEWCKMTNFELATHAPMMVRVPGETDNGVVTEKMTEFVDLFPSLVEAAGLPQLDICPENSQNITVCREGTSFIPLIKDPDMDWKPSVFSQYQRDGNKVMGYTMRNDKYRYTEWVEFEKAPVNKPDWDKMVGVELYDHGTDPEENHSQAHNPKYASIRQQLSQSLRAGWRQAQPGPPQA